VNSDSYPKELAKFFPSLHVYQQACPMWVPLIENGEYDKPGADYFVKEYIDLLFKQSKDIDTILLACTHYPLLAAKIKSFLPNNVTLVTQGHIVAQSLAQYLQNHPEMDQKCSKTGAMAFYTTDNALAFEKQASIFFGQKIEANHTDLV
jgi:glutamate racemase